MTFATYTENGRRMPFDPAEMARQISGCCLCGRRRVAMVGIFIPTTARLRQAVLMLRRHPIPDGRAVGTAYGLCARCAKRDGVIDRVEEAILRSAEKVRGVVQ